MSREAAAQSCPQAGTWLRLSDGRDILYRGAGNAPGLCRASVSGEPRETSLLLGLYPPPPGNAAQHRDGLQRLLPLRDGAVVRYVVFAMTSAERFEWRVAREERFAGPLGEMPAYRISLERTGLFGSPAATSRTYWIAADTGLILRMRTAFTSDLEGARPDLDALAVIAPSSPQRAR
jgi:hypothetical protein